MVIKAEDMPDIGDEGPIEEEVSTDVSAGDPSTEDSSDEDHSTEDVSADAAAAMAQQSRTLRNSIIGLAIFFALVAGLLLAVPGLRAAGERISDAHVGWVAAGIGLEILSCAGYVVLFGLVFGMLSRRLISRSVAVRAGGQLGRLGQRSRGHRARRLGAARTRGVSVERIAKRSVLIFVLTSAVNVGATALIGIPMWLGLLPGSRNPLLTLLPAAAAVAVIAGHDRAGGVGAAWGRAAHPLARTHVCRADCAERWRVRRAGADPSSRDWRLLGAVAYCLFDIATLYVCLLAYGPAPSFWVVAMAYLVGMLANSLPIPAGPDRGRRGAVRDAAVVRRAPRLAGARGRRHLPGGLAVGAGADRLGRVLQHSWRAQPSGRDAATPTQTGAGCL